MSHSEVEDQDSDIEKRLRLRKRRTNIPLHTKTVGVDRLGPSGGVEFYELVYMFRRKWCIHLTECPRYLSLNLVETPQYQVGWHQMKYDRHFFGRYDLNISIKV